ncbi:MAG: AAA family ATPase [Cyanobacteria bacterium P01_D01_bin.56]
MGIDTAIEFTDSLLYEKTGQHLSDLQCCILQQVWGGKTYRAIAIVAGYSEGHVKDVASQLWRLLSDVLGERITKGNYRSRLVYWLKRARRKVVHVADRVGGPVLSKSPQHSLEALDPLHTNHLDPHFIGRDPALETLSTLSNQGHKIIVIQGEGGLGKTTLAQHYLRQVNFDVVLEWRIAQETSNLTAVEHILDEWLRQDFNDEPGQDLSISLSRLKRHLKHHTIGILIDNLEPALDKNGQFVGEARGYTELLKLLSDFSIQATTLITSRDRLCEPGIKAHHYRLPSLTLDNWQQCFVYHKLCLTKAESIVRHLHRAYGGNAKAMEILCSTVQTDFNGDLVAYWQTYGANPLAEIALKNLVISQVERLHTLDPVAYQLLCRLSCYRYQTIAKLPLAAILVQGDGTDAQGAIASLRNRSLLEVDNGEYWLHPVIRAVAIERLRQNNQLWQHANQTAADYWTTSIKTLTCLIDAQRALEAYYHHIAINNHQAAAKVLLKSRHNQWHQFLPLASSLYRMGLLHPVSSLIIDLLSHLEHETETLLQISELRNILGDICWITGEIKQAIECQQTAITTTQHHIAAHKHSNTLAAYYPQMLNIDSRLSLGLYAVDLWELDQAEEAFITVINLGENTRHQAWADKATVALALTYAYQGRKQVALTLAKKCLHAFTHQSEKSGRLAYFIQLLGQTYGHLRDLAQAEKLHTQALSFAEAGHYPQVKAKALTGLAISYRQAHQLSMALQHHTQSIELFESIGAKCDLANAYVELGHSYISLQQLNIAHQYWQQALELYGDIDAQKQVHRVEQLLNTRS